MSSASTTQHPTLPPGIEQHLRALKMPHARAVAADLLAAAKSQRWELIEVLRALLPEELAGRSKSVIGAR